MLSIDHFFLLLIKLIVKDTEYRLIEFADRNKHLDFMQLLQFDLYWLWILVLPFILERSAIHYTTRALEPHTNTQLDCIEAAALIYLFIDWKYYNECRD